MENCNYSFSFDFVFSFYQTILLVAQLLIVINFQATHLSGESIVIDTMLGTVIILHPVVNVYFFKLIMVSEWTIRYINSYLRFFVRSKHQKLPSIMQVSGNLKAALTSLLVFNFNLKKNKGNTNLLTVKI